MCSAFGVDKIHSSWQRLAGLAAASFASGCAGNMFYRRPVSIHRNVWVHVPRPGIDTALQIMQFVKALTLQKCDDLQTSHAVMTNYDRRMRTVDLLNVCRDLAHGYMPGALDMCNLPFPGLAYIEQKRLLFVRRGQHAMELRGSKLAHEVIFGKGAARKRNAKAG